MSEVTVEAVLRAPLETVHDHLTPESIMDYERTYEVLEVEADGDGWIVTTYADSETGMIVRFEELPNGYAYKKVEGFFEDLHTTVAVHEVGQRSADGKGGRTTSSSTRSSPSAGMLAPVIDRLATRQRRKELKRALSALGGNINDAEIMNDSVVDTADCAAQ